MQLRYFSIKIVTMAIAFLCIAYKVGASDWLGKTQGLFEKAQESGALEKAQGLISPKAAEPAKEIITSDNPDAEDETPPVVELIPAEKTVVKSEALAAEPTTLESAEGLVESSQGLYKKATGILAPKRTEAEKASAQAVEEQKVDYKIKAKEKAKNPSWLKYLNN
jgi:hypothetical protein